MNTTTKVAKWAVYSAATILVKGWAITMLWQWFLRPCCFLSIALPQAIGLVVLAHFVMHPPKLENLDDPVNIEVDGMKVIVRILFSIFVVAICWPLSLVMP